MSTPIDDVELNNKIANLIKLDRKDSVFNYEDWSDLMPLVIKYSKEINRAMQELGDYDFWILLDSDSQRSLAEYLLEALEKLNEYS